MYRLLKDDATGRERTDMILRTIDNANIPNDMGNRDWIAYQAWLQLGNLPEEE